MWRFLKQTGVWVFAASVVVFFAGQMYLSANKPKEVQSANSSVELDAQSIHAIRIERSGGPLEGKVLSYSALNIKIVEPSRNLTASFDANIYELKSHVEGDVLVLAFTAPDVHGAQRRKHAHGSGNAQLLVPSSIRTLEFSNDGPGFLRISTEMPDALTDLDVRFADCNSNGNFGSIVAKKLTVTKRCPPSKTGRGGTLNFDRMKVNQLVVTSTHGSIQLEGPAEVGVLQLNLADNVRVIADAAQLRNAHFGKTTE